MCPVLSVGVPGSGKSYLARAIGAQVPNFYRLQACDLCSRWLPEVPADLLNSYFEAVIANQPSVLFIDDLEQIYELSRETELICSVIHSQLDGITSRGDRVILIAATNKPWCIADDILRRFKQLVYLPLPHQAARVHLIKLLLRDLATDFPMEALEKLGEPSSRLSGADISTYIRDVMMQIVRKVQVATHFKQVSGPDPDDPSKTAHDLMTVCDPHDPDGKEMTWMDVPSPRFLDPAITMEDMETCLGNMRPSTSESDLIEIQTFTVPQRVTSTD